MEEIRENVQPERSKPLFIVSDFHGVYDAIEIVEDKLKKKNRRVVILGDCMDRGNGGIHLLSRIKELAENGESITYLPGNHDEALYTRFKHFVEVYKNNNKKITDEMVTIFSGIVKAAKYEGFAKANGQIPTFEEIIEMTSSPEGLKEFFELMIWLENQPLLMIEKDCDGRKIAMGHAAFDMDLYEMDEPITLGKKALIDKRAEELSESAPNSEEFKKVKELQKKANACLWYRNPNDVDSTNRDGIVRLPEESEADVIVVGHTPKQEEIDIIGENITRKAIDVDGGTVECYLSGRGEMLKFEPFKEGLPSPIMVTAFVVAGRKGAYKKMGMMDEYEELENGSDKEQEVEEDDGDMKVYIPGQNKKKKVDSDPDDDFGDI